VGTRRHRVEDAGDAKALEIARRGAGDFSPVRAAWGCRISVVVQRRLARWGCGGGGAEHQWGGQAGAFLCEVLGARAHGMAVDRVG
jgi:hypothetical protein